MSTETIREEVAEDADSVLFDQIEDGKLHEFDLIGFDRSDGGPCIIPVHVLAGRGPRPRLVAIAGVHGDEPDGMLALLDAISAIAPASLRGRLITVPIAHPPAFAAGQRRSPIDGLDLNRVFPGSPEGMPTERLAHCLFDRVIKHADFIFTLHSWYATGTVLPFVEIMDDNSAVAVASLAAARASGFERIRLTTWPTGLLVRVANSVGIPGMEAEIGDSGISSPANQALYRHHLDCLLWHLGMIEVPPPKQDVRAETFRGHHMRSSVAGILQMNVSLGEEVSENKLVADVKDIRGRRIGAIRSPTAGKIVSRRSYGSVAVGDIVATVFSLAENGGRQFPS